MHDDSAARYDNEVAFDRPNNPHSFALALIGADKDVLELGCAVGHVTERLVERNNRVVGVEIDPDAAERARRFADTVHVVDLDHTPLSSVETRTFDVIYAGDCLEHLRDPATSLADLVTLLRPDGRLVISIPNVAHADMRLMLLEGRWEQADDGILDHTHLRWFTREGLRELLASVGFTATRVERVVLGIGDSSVPTNPALHGRATIDLIAADPEHLTYQFVVEAARSGADELARDPIEYPKPDVEVRELEALRAHATALEEQRDALQSHATALEEQATALRNEIEALHNSSATKLTAALKAARRRFK